MAEMQSWVTEPRELLGLPVSLPARTLPSTARAVDGGLDHKFETTGWRIAHGGEASNGTDAAVAPVRRRCTGVLHVLLALLARFASARFPSDGRVTFSPYEILCELEWARTVRSSCGTKRLKPSGFDYASLSGAFAALRKTIYVQQGYVSPGAEPRFATPFRLIREVTFGVGRGPDSWAVLSPTLVESLRGDAARVTYDYVLARRLETRRALELYRLLLWMRATGTRSLRLLEVFDRLGLQTREVGPSRFRRLLGDASQELVQQGVLRNAPEVSGGGSGGSTVRFTFGDLRMRVADADFLFRCARLYGVIPTVAEDLAANRRERLAQVLAAATLGLVQPTKDLPRMINWMSRNDMPLWTASEAPRLPIAFFGTNSLDGYLQYAAADRLEKATAQDHEAAIVSSRTRLDELGLAQSEWLVRGLGAMALNDRLAIPGFHAYWAGRRVADSV